MEKVHVLLEPLFHRDQNSVAIRFPKDYDLISIVRRLPNRKFSLTHQCWYVPDTPSALDEIKEAFNGKAEVDVTAFRVASPVVKKETEKAERDIREEHIKALRMMEQKLHLKGYSKPTEKTYLEQFKLFLRFFPDSHPLDLGEAEIQVYLLYLVEQKKLSKSTQNQAINSIKFFYEKVLKQERKVYYLERPMKDKRLPQVLSQQEVLLIFEALDNIKHRLMLMLIYAAGLRRSELLALRTGDVDPDRNTVFVRGGKGRKDRQTVMAQSLAPLLRQYLKEYAPSFWLFEGRAGQKYSESSLQQVLKQAAGKAGIRKNVHLHMLRHSFATHLLESGTSTRYIQVLLGHESPKTTEIYAHVTRFGLDKIQSPLDQIAATKKLKGEDE